MPQRTAYIIRQMVEMMKGRIGQGHAYAMPDGHDALSRPLKSYKDMDALSGRSIDDNDRRAHA